MRQFLIALTAVVFSIFIYSTGMASIEGAYTPKAEIPGNLRLSAENIDMGRVFYYPTGFGDVKIDAEGSSAGITTAFKSKAQFGYKYMDYKIDSEFAGVSAGASHARANEYSVKFVFPEKEALTTHKFKYGVQYRFIDAQYTSDIHFCDAFAGTNLGNVEATGGISAYFGGDTDNRLGVFINLSYKETKNIEYFAEYSTADYLKAIQNYMIAPAAQGIGTVNVSGVPKDAFSFGMKMRFDDGPGFSFSIYDLDKQMRPVIGLTLDR